VSFPSDSVGYRDYCNQNGGLWSVEEWHDFSVTEAMLRTE
jgi:hypothetical protein